MDGAWMLNTESNHEAGIRTALESVRRHRGCVSLNFHPEILATQPHVWTWFEKTVRMATDLGAELGTVPQRRHQA